MVRVCVRVCMSVRACAYVRTCVRACMCLYMHVCVCVYIRALHVSVYMFVWEYSLKCV